MFVFTCFMENYISNDTLNAKAGFLKINVK